MKVEIIKAEEIKEEYKAGDIISLGNPYEVNHFLLVEHKDNTNVGAINLTKGIIDLQVSKVMYGFEGLVELILDNNDWDEWTLIKNENAKLTLDCKDGTKQQRNNSGLF